MSVKRVTPTDWTRREFVRNGLAAASVMALGGYDPANRFRVYQNILPSDSSGV
ncbi:MAG: hypothetical protein IPK97_19235 [Ahniella sp.]|nr:hypothetical protein [Ahniella sp.]